MINFKSRLVVALLFLISLAGNSATAQPFEINWYTIDTGGGNSAGGQFDVSGTIGQPDAAYSTGGQYEIASGYWSSTVPSIMFTAPTSFVIERGLQVDPVDLSDFQNSDDDHANMNPGFTLNNNEAPVWIRFLANAPDAVEFIVESKAGTPGLTYTVEAWNYANNSYDLLGNQSETFNTDTVVAFAMSADNSDNNGDVWARVGWRKTGLTINFPWQVSIDQVGWNH